MDEQKIETKKSNKTLYIVLAVAGCIFLIPLCIGILFFFFVMIPFSIPPFIVDKASEDPVAFCTGYLRNSKELETGRVDEKGNCKGANGELFPTKSK